MIQPIYLYGSEVLRQKAGEADISKPEEVRQLVRDLKDTLQKAEGCGLAAPQIGVSKRVLIVDGREMTDIYPYLEGFFRVIINPVVTFESAEQCEFNEGCLSVPGIYSDVRRPSIISVEYYDENLTKQVETFDRFACRMVQHELSHLDGCLFTDLVAPIRRKMLAKKLTNIAHGKTATHYNSKIR